MPPIKHGLVVLLCRWSALQRFAGALDWRLARWRIIFRRHFSDEFVDWQFHGRTIAEIDIVDFYKLNQVGGYHYLMVLWV